MPVPNAHFSTGSISVKAVMYYERLRLIFKPKVDPFIRRIIMLELSLLPFFDSKLDLNWPLKGSNICSVTNSVQEHQVCRCSWTSTLPCRRVDVGL